MGAAAAALGTLLACALPRDAILDGPASPQRAVNALLTALQNTPKLARSSAAKCGIAAGLAALLGVSYVFIWSTSSVRCCRACPQEYAYGTLKSPSAAAGSAHGAWGARRAGLAADVARCC